MVLPGLLIEYFINGALSLIWLYPLFVKYQFIEKWGFKLSDPIAAVLVAASLYFLGMAIDIVAWQLTKRYKNNVVRKGVVKKYFIGENIGKSSLYREVILALHAPDLAREFAMRSSRDRIARDAVLNSVIATIVYALLSSNILMSVTIGGIATVSCFLMWQSFEKASYGFELNAEKILNKEHPEAKQDKFL